MSRDLSPVTHGYLGKDDCGEDEGAARKLTGTHALIKDEPAGNYRKNGLQTHEHGGDCGVKALLPYDLKGICHSAGHDAGIKDRYPGV